MIGGQSFVYLAVKGQGPLANGFVAHQVPVKLGDINGNTYPVLSGLKPGDRVIESGLQMIGEGAPVHAADRAATRSFWRTSRGLGAHGSLERKLQAERAL